MNIWLLVDKVAGRISRHYHRKVLLARTHQRAAAPQNCRVLGKVYVNATNVTLGKNVTIYPGVYFWGDGEILIGDNCVIGIGTVIFASKQGGVRIGNNVSIAAHCYVIDSNHRLRRDDLIRNQPLDSARIIIGDDVWIAAHCAVIKGAEIQEGAVIGAGSVVNNLIPPYSVAVGSPARVIRVRS